MNSNFAISKQTNKQTNKQNKTKQQQQQQKPNKQTKTETKTEIVFNWNKRIIRAYSSSEKKKRKAMGFCSFCWETDLWVTLGDFKVKNKKQKQKWEGKSVFNWKSIKLKLNVMCCR